MSAKTPVKGHASKHVHKAKKHHKAKGKHHPAHTHNPVPQFRVVPPHAVGKPAGHPKPRGFAVDGLPVCAFEAVAMSLRLAGQFVHDEEVAGLWELAGSPALGASLGAALDAAGDYGLAGFRPQRMRLEWPGPAGSQEHLPLPFAQHEAGALGPVDDMLPGDFHALILGVDVPGPHAVLATADGWWSWGELHDPWPCRIEEAWAVSWS